MNYLWLCMSTKAGFDFKRDKIYIHKFVHAPEHIHIHIYDFKKNKTLIPTWNIKS